MRRCLAIVCAIFSFGGAHAHEFHVSVKGNDHNPGTVNRPVRTIDRAARLAEPGDTITVHAGTYRERVDPPRGGISDKKRILYRAAPGEKVAIKGSEIVKGWNQTTQGIWQLSLPDSFFGDINPYTDLIFGDWYFGDGWHTGEVYLNDSALQEVIGDSSAVLQRPNTWSVRSERGKTILFANVGTADPNAAVVEINVRPTCFYPTKTHINYLTVRGFRIGQAASQWAAPTAEQVGAIGTNWSKGWIIEDNIVSNSKCVGMTLGKDRASGQNPWSADMSKDGSVTYNDMVKTVIGEGWDKATIGSHIVRNNEVHDCGEAGICGSFGAIYSQLIHNHIHDIYTHRKYYGAEMAGIKLHGAIDVLIKDNQVNHSFIGIWLDWMAQGTRVSGNLLYDNDYVDFFPEVDHGPYLVDNNLFLSPISLKDWSEGGAYVCNLFAGSLSRQPQDRETPFFKRHSTVLAGVKAIHGGDDRFDGNVFVGRTAIPQPPKMHGADVQDSMAGFGLSIYANLEGSVQAAGNVYCHGATPLSPTERGSSQVEFNPVIQLSSNAAGVFLHSQWPSTSTQFAGLLLNSATLGTTLVSKQGFEAPDGHPPIIKPTYLQLLDGDRVFPVWFNRPSAY